MVLPTSLPKFTYVVAWFFFPAHLAWFYTLGDSLEKPGREQVERGAYPSSPPARVQALVLLLSPRNFGIPNARKTFRFYFLLEAFAPLLVAATEKYFSGIVDRATPPRPPIPFSIKIYVVFVWRSGVGIEIAAQKMSPASPRLALVDRRSRYDGVGLENLVFFRYRVQVICTGHTITFS